MSRHVEDVSYDEMAFDVPLGYWPFHPHEFEAQSGDFLVRA